MRCPAVTASLLCNWSLLLYIAHKKKNRKLPLVWPLCSQFWRFCSFVYSLRIYRLVGDTDWSKIVLGSTFVPQYKAQAPQLIFADVYGVLRQLRSSLRNSNSILNTALHKSCIHLLFLNRRNERESPSILLNLTMATSHTACPLCALKRKCLSS
jgi:hypothetical protein